MRHREGERPIPSYKLEAFLGEGGYGEVWRATGPGGVPCALKFIKLDSNAGMKELRSIGLVKKLRHPNLVPLQAVWLMDEDGNLMSSDGGDGNQSLSFRVYGNKELVIAMGLGSGSLADKLAGARAEKAADALPGGLGLRRLLGYIQDAARGIDCLNDPPAHDNPGILPLVHCDIKPANLLLVGGCVQVCDYGVAKAVGKDIKKTMAAGTAAYAPPELINNDPGLKSDQYSLAISYYELRTGHLPLDETKAMMAHLMGMLDFSRVPTEEREVLQQATAMKVSDRFDTCEDFVEALHIATGRTIAGPSGAHKALTNRPSSQPDTAGEIELPPLPPPPPPRPTSDVLRPHGSPVGGYTLEKMLGQGGYGQVWQANDPDGVPCALKILRDVTGKGRHEYETLVRLRRLDHPNLLRIEQLWVLDEFWAPIPAEQIGRPDGREARRMVIRTPLADKNLFQKLTESRRLSQPGIPPTELLKYLRQAADALDYLNIEQQTQHRDVKPENLLLKGETLWVSDFGLAKVVPIGGVTAQSTSSGMTQEYASPEVLTNKQVTEHSDQYSLAVTYHVLRTGRLPFPPGLSMLDLIKARAHGSLDLNDVTEAERPILRRALSATPSDRFPNCRELMRELAVALNLSTTHHLPAPPSGRMARQAPRPKPPSDPVNHQTLILEAVTPSPVGPGTQIYQTTETEVRFETDPLAPEPATDAWASDSHVAGPRTSTRHKPTPRPPERRTEFVDDRPVGGGSKLLVGGLAAVAVFGIGVAGYIIATGGSGVWTVASSPDTTPTPPTLITPATAPTPPTGTTPATQKPSDAVRRKPVVDLVAKGDFAAARDKLDGLPADTPGLELWKAAWVPVLRALTSPAPETVPTADLVRVANEFAPAETPPVDGSSELRAARSKVITRYSVPAVRRLDEVSDWKAVKAALSAADPSDPWVTAGIAEAELELTKTPPTVSAPAGFADYLKAVGQPMNGDALAAVTLSGDWVTPRRTAKLADQLAAVVVKARKPDGGYTDNTDKVARWLWAAHTAADKLGPKGEALRQKLTVDTVLVLGNRPEVDRKAAAKAAAGRLNDEALKSFAAADRSKAWATAEALGAANPYGKRAKLTDLRQKVSDPKVTPETVKTVLAQLTDPSTLLGDDPTPEARKVLAEVLAATSRLVYRNRDEWGPPAGFGTPAENLRQATDLARQAAEQGNRPEDFGWQGILLLAADEKTSSAVLSTLAGKAGEGVAGQVLRGAANRKNRAAALREFREAIILGRQNVEQNHGELVQAYRIAGPLAIAEAVELPPSTTRSDLLADAIKWGLALAKLEPNRADGLIIAGCGYEDRAWKDRMPVDKAERCGPSGPYHQADATFKKAVGLRYDIDGAVATNLGRNLFKWAEDDCQLGRWTADDTPKSSPNTARLDAAVAALTPVGSGKGTMADEARYWLAEVAILRFQASNGDKQALQLAESSIVRILPKRNTKPTQWQMGVERLVGIHTAEADRQEKAGDLPAAVAAATRASDAATLQAAPDSHVAALLVRQAGLILAQGSDTPAKRAALHPAARKALAGAIKLDPNNPARWEWRSTLGQVEMAAARDAKDSDKKQATVLYAAACNNLRVAQVVGNLQQQANPAVAPAYNQMLKQIGPNYGEIERFLKTEYPDGLPNDRFGAAVRLVWIDLDYEADRNVANLKGPQVTKTLSVLRTDKTPVDVELLDAGKAAAERVLNRQ